jgi:type II secretion system protein H
MKLFNRESIVESSNRCLVEPARRNGPLFNSTIPRFHDSTVQRAFTLVELLLVLVLLVVVTSMVAPAMSNFIRARALGSEARRLSALLHAGQSRAVSEGLPALLWVDEKKGAYGLTTETPPEAGDAKAEDLPLDENLSIAVLNAGTTGATTFQNLPAIRFLPDGTVDENSPQMLRLTDAKGNALWLAESRNHMGYEIRDTEK